MNFSFEITEVHARWFAVTISSDDRSVEVVNSYYLNNDAPKSLLQKLCRLLEQKTEECWICFTNEPCAYIWHLQKTGTDLLIQIDEAKKDAWDLPFEGHALSDEVTIELMFSERLPLIKFARKVKNAFEKYSNGDALMAYEREWDKFPMESFLLLKELLQCK